MELFKLFGSVFLKGADEANSQLDGLNSKASGMSKAFDGVGKVAGVAVKAGAAVAAAAGTAAVAFGVGAVNAAKDFEVGMANVATLLDGDVTTKIAKMGDAVQDMQRKTGMGAAVLQDGLYQVVSAFGDSADSMKILETAAQGAAAGQATVTDSVNLLSAVTKGYGDTSAKAVEKASDLAFLTVKLGQTTFPELAASMGAVIPLASAMSVSQEELFGAMATLTGVTGGTSEVTTQLRGTIQGLMKPTKEMQGALEKMGYKTGAAALESLGLQGTLAGLNEQVKGDKTELGNLFGSVEAVNAVLALTGSQAENFTEKTKAMKDAAGATSAAFDVQQETLAAALARGKETLNTFMTDVGQKFLPGIVDGFSGLLDKVTPILDGFSEKLNAAGDDMGKVGEAVGQTLGDLINLVAENAPQYIDAGVALVTSLLDGILTALPALGTAAVDLVLRLAQALLEALPTIIEVGMQVLMQLINGIVAMLPELIPMAIGIIFALVDALLANLDQLLAAAINIIVALVEGLVVALPQLVQYIPQIINAIVTAILENLPLIIEAAIRIIIALIVGIVQMIPQLIAYFPMIIASIIGAFKKINWGQVGKDIIAGIAKGVTDAAGRLVDAAVKAAKAALDKVKEWLGIKSPSRRFAVEVGQQIPAGQAAGIEEAAGLVDDAMEDATPDPEDYRWPKPAVPAGLGGGAGALALAGAGAGTGGAWQLHVDGEVTLKGVNDAGEVVATRDLLYNEIIEIVRQEVRR